VFSFQYDRQVFEPTHKRMQSYARNSHPLIFNQNKKPLDSEEAPVSICVEASVGGSGRENIVRAAIEEGNPFFLKLNFERTNQYHVQPVSPRVSLCEH